MKIRMLVGMAGDPQCARGEIIDRPEKEALRFIEHGIAERVDAEDATAPKGGKVERKVEKAVADSAATETRGKKAV